MQGFKDEFQAASSQRLTQLTGRPHPPADAHTSPISPVTGGSVLTQAPLPAVGSVKPSRAFWEKTHTEEGEVQLLTPQSPVEPRQTPHPPPSCLFPASHRPSVQLGPVQPGVHAHCPLAGWQLPSLRQLQVWLQPFP